MTDMLWGYGSLVLFALAVVIALFWSIEPLPSLRETFEKLPDDPKTESELPPLEHWLKESEEAKAQRKAPQ